MHAPKCHERKLSPVLGVTLTQTKPQSAAQRGRDLTTYLQFMRVHLSHSSRRLVPSVSELAQQPYKK